MFGALGVGEKHLVRVSCRKTDTPSVVPLFGFLWKPLGVPGVFRLQAHPSAAARFSLLLRRRLHRGPGRTEPPRLFHQIKKKKNPQDRKCGSL